jgi:hypothetical protein
MRHHFGDLLDRDGDYWTIIPNFKRYAYRVGDLPNGSSEITIITIGKQDENWERIFTFPNLVEVTLHEPSGEQLEAARELTGINRLRITHARPHSIDFIRSLVNVEELVLEYVSGFTDLSPLRDLPRLRALHLENLRKVSNFDGLAGIKNLKYLKIHGTLDWLQPIDSFDFLRGLPNLEVLGAWQFACKKPYPVMLPVMTLKHLKKLMINGYLPVEEFALMEECLPGVKGADWGPYQIQPSSYVELSLEDIRASLPATVIREKHPEIRIHEDGSRWISDPSNQWVRFTGKGKRDVQLGTPQAEKKCREAAEKYEALKQAAKLLVQSEKDK